MNLKVGDKVIIRNDLSAGSVDVGYMEVGVTDDMAQCAGKVATILRERWPGVYGIDLDDDSWCWYKAMFEEKVDAHKQQPQYEVLYEKPYYINDYVKKVIVNGNVTIVFLETGEKGIAKCNPNDKFKVGTGYEIARSRAMIEHYKNLIKGEQELLEYLY